LVRILVTGASGFVGGHLSKHLLDRGNSIVSIAHDSVRVNTSALLGIEDKIDWAHGDITNYDFVKRVVADYEVEQIYHLAALPIVRVAHRTTIPIFEANVMGSVALFEAAKEQHLSGYPMSVLYVATDKVYGDAGPRPYKEEDPLNGLGIYESSKACSDLLARAYHHNFGIRIVVARPCNIFGTADLNSRLIPNSIRRCLLGLSPVIYEGNSYVREFVYTTDACEAMISLMEHVNDFAGSAFNIGSGFHFNQEEVISSILKRFPKIKPEYRKPQTYMAREIPYQRLDSTKIEEVIGWRAKVSFEDGLDKVISWWKEHTDLIRYGLQI
jgi:CDP-glucose 4,6-dehydratase